MQFSRIHNSVTLSEKHVILHYSCLPPRGYHTANFDQFAVVIHEIWVGQTFVFFPLFFFSSSEGQGRLRLFFSYACKSLCDFLICSLIAFKFGRNVTSSVKRGLIAFLNSQLLQIISPQVSKLRITFTLHQTIVLCKGYIRTKFQSIKVKLRILNYVLLGLAIKPVFTEPVTNKEHIRKGKFRYRVWYEFDKYPMCNLVNYHRGAFWQLESQKNFCQSYRAKTKQV